METHVYFYSNHTGKSFLGKKTSFKDEGDVQQYINRMEKRGYYLDERYNIN